MNFKTIKRTLLVVGIGLSSFTHANTPDSYMIIVQKNGSESNDSIYIGLLNHPKIEFEGESFSISSEDITVTYENTVKIAFTTSLPVVDRIEQTKVDQEKMLFLDKNTIEITGLSSSNDLRVFAIDGKWVSPSMSISDGKAIIHLDALVQGVYIIKTKHQSFKVVKK